MHQTIRNFLILFLLLFPFSSHASRADKLYKRAAKDFHKLYQPSRFRTYESNWLKTIQKFEIIYKTFPRHTRASQSLFNIGSLYRSLYKWNKKSIYIDRSNLSLRRLVKFYTNSQLADDAQYALAENYDTYKKDKSLAYLEYKKLIENFPSSNFSKKARIRLKKLTPSTNHDLDLETDQASILLKKALRTPQYGGVSDKVSRKKRTTKVLRVDYWSTSEWSRLVINTKEAIRYKYQSLKPDPKNKKGDRIFFDLYNTYIPKKFKKNVATNDGIIKRLRIAQFDKKTVRIVLDLDSLKKMKVFNFKLPNQNKIVIDVQGTSLLSDLGEYALKNHRQEKKSEVKKRNKAHKESRISLSDVLGLKIKKIIIDPGHGGKDPGAIGFGIHEKNIALKLALKLKKNFNRKDPDLQIILTRKDDTFIQLEERTALANKNNGDLFVSIHLNASENKKALGIETYFLNLTTDNSALKLAAKENQFSAQSVSEISNILEDLMTDTKIQESSELANLVQLSMFHRIRKKASYKTKNLGVKKAPFMVLIGAQMPSILIEAGFLTNRKENKLLVQSKYQEIVAEGIYNGIQSYIKPKAKFSYKN